MSARLTIVRQQKHGEVVVARDEIVSIRSAGIKQNRYADLFGVLEKADGTAVGVPPRSDLRAYNRNDGVTLSRLCRTQQQHLRARVVGGVSVGPSGADVRW